MMIALIHSLSTCTVYHNAHVPSFNICNRSIRLVGALLSGTGRRNEGAWGGGRCQEEGKLSPLTTTGSRYSAVPGNTHRS